jgi:hypothetical protein
MQISVKDFAVAMELGNNGIEFEVRDNNGQHRGDLCLGRGTVEWCPGRTRRGNGVQRSWDDLINWFGPA